MDFITGEQAADAGAVRGIMTALCARYSFLHSQPIGCSAAGRELYALRLGGGKEAVLFAAAFHGQEWLTSLVTLRLCEELCAALHDGQPLCGMEMATALCGRALWFVPQVNPDGVCIALHGSHSAGSFAGPVRARGGDVFGLWQANARGVDINHNFNADHAALRERETAAGIVGPAPRRYGGEWPESEPETAAITALCRHHTFRHAIALHSQGEEIYWHYGDRTPPGARLMADVMAAASGYAVSEPEGLAVGGGFKDWFVTEFGRPAFTIEMGKGQNPLPLADFEPLYDKAREMLVLAALL